MKYDKGSAIVIEVEFKKYTPFTGYSYFNPTTYKITVTDPEANKKVDQQDLLYSATGKYYYVVQTEVTWISGAYIVQIDAGDGVNTDITINPQLFYLK